uniref:Nucleoporin_C domain-containing protein n=1 Tax=Hydatigena taeniaeformis TaxID=6205 RepID=A0A0R3WL44_HYDTA
LPEDISAWYSGHDRYLLESMLIFALRRNFMQAASKIASVMRQGGLQPSSMTLWCLNAQSSRLHNLAKQCCTTSADSELVRILEELSEAAEALVTAVGCESPFRSPLLRYKLDVDKLLMFLYLESPKEDQFPHLDREIQSFRSDYARLLTSAGEAESYIANVWSSNRETAFAVLFADAQVVASHLPYTFFDQVGTRHHELFVQAVKKTQTGFGQVVLSVLADAKEELTESKLTQIADALRSP